MAFDIQFVYPQQAIKVTSVTLLSNLVVPTLAVEGDDFSAVDEVLLNEIASPAFIVKSKTLLFAALPKEVRGERHISVTVVSYRTVYSPQSIVSFQLGKGNRKASGINRLLQLFLKTLLTTPGIDIFTPSVGGGGLRNIGQTFSKSNSGGLVGDFIISVDSTARQITAMQARQRGLSKTERLLNARVTTARFDASQTALVVSIELTSQAGIITTANITL